MRSLFIQLCKTVVYLVNFGGNGLDGSGYSVNCISDLLGRVILVSIVIVLAQDSIVLEPEPAEEEEVEEFEEIDEAAEEEVPNIVVVDGDPSDENTAISSAGLSL